MHFIFESYEFLIFIQFDFLMIFFEVFAGDHAVMDHFIKSTTMYIFTFYAGAYVDYLASWADLYDGLFFIEHQESVTLRPVSPI